MKLNEYINVCGFKLKMFFQIYLYKSVKMIKIDSYIKDQEKYLNSWEEGT
jgi:hypothetical protein